MHLKSSFYEFVKMLPAKLSQEGSYAIFHALPFSRAFIPTLFECGLLGERFLELMVASSLSLLDKTFQNSCLKLTI